LDLEGVQYLLGKGRKDKSGDFTKGAELNETQIKQIINFLSIKDLSDSNFEKIEKIAGENKTILDGVNELILIKKYFSLLKFENFYL
jgi:histidyl-tRNA synthetase